jgi:hypothetical protein
MMNVQGKGPMSNSFAQGITSMFPDEGYTAAGTVRSSLADMKLEATIDGISFLSKARDVTRVNCCGWGVKMVSGRLALNRSGFENLVKRVSTLYPPQTARIYPLRFDGNAYLVECDNAKNEVFILLREMFDGTFN